jgi:hypothetical protein
MEFHKAEPRGLMSAIRDIVEDPERVPVFCAQQGCRWRGTPRRPGEGG